MPLHPDDVTLTISADQLSSIAKRLRQFYSLEYSEDLPEWMIIDALTSWLEHRFEAITEDIEEVLSSPQRSESHEFRKYLEESMREVQIVDHPEAIPEISREEAVFTGQRIFSFEKLAAMTAYIAARGKDVYKTKLNKLLFYSDFVNYYLNGVSISGSRYVHLPYGPVPDRYESTLQNLVLTGMVEIIQGRGFEVVRAKDEPITGVLKNKERETLDWVLENFGQMSASDISEFSHQEKAYRFTKAGEFIAYEYAKFFQKLPQPRGH
jgi:uncharacterized phage-associated protein